MMEKISSTAELKNAIEVLEVEQAVKLQQLKEQLNLTLDSLNPKNLVANSITDFSASPTIFDKVISAITGALTGYISKRLIIAGSGNRLRKIAGTLIHLLIIKFLASHPEKVTSFRQFLLHKIFKIPVTA
jgi:hypothetical protein